MAYEPLPPPLTIAEAEARGVLIVGSCDWGGCNREAAGARWDRETGQYLTVCAPCSRSKRVREQAEATGE